MVPSCETPAFARATDVSILFEDMVQCLESLPSLLLKGVRLPVPGCMTKGSDFFSSKVKEFCVGLLENPVDHAWWPVVRHCDSGDRMAVAGSLFLFRKVLPVLPSDPAEQRSRISADPLPEVPGYPDFIRQVVTKLFPVGWDKGFKEALGRTSPNVSSCLQASRGKGGVRSCWLGRREEFLSADVDRVGSFCQYVNVETGGKSRGVTVNSSDHLHLEPVHKLLYNHLSRFPWLLRGEAKPCKFSSFRRRKGLFFISGDYSAATDNLSLENAELILTAIFSRCRYIPVRLQLACLRSLRMKVCYEGLDVPVEMTRGQLMGSFLSFPLLCVQNYIAFRFAVPGDRPVKVNGDDIVWQGTPEEFRRWTEFCPRVGLKIHPTKTMCHRTFFSLNSSFFRASESRVSLVPVVRMATLQKDLDGPSALGGAFRSFCLGWKGTQREVVERVFLLRRNRAVRASGRSLRLLGIKASQAAVSRAGLWRRELWYSEGVPESLPPVLPGKLRWARLPEGWGRVPLPSSASRRRALVRDESEFFQEVVALSWVTPPVSEREQRAENWNRARSTGWEGAFVAWTRRSKPSVRFKRSLGWRFPTDTEFMLGVDPVKGVDPYHLRMGRVLRDWLYGPSGTGRLVWRRERKETSFVLGSS